MKRPKTQVRTKERYILDSLEDLFKGGEWVTPAVEPMDRANGSENYEQPLYLTGSYLTVIGGQKYDSNLEQYIESVDEDVSFIVGDGRGAEDWVCKHDHNVLKVPVNPDLYGKAARKVNVEQVLSFAPTSPLLLVGTGERVKQAKQWLKRAKWPREVVEIL